MPRRGREKSASAGLLVTDLPGVPECNEGTDGGSPVLGFREDSKAAAVSEFVLRQQNKTKTARQGREIFASAKILLTESGSGLP